MCNQKELVYRCKQLILALRRRKQNCMRALEIYSRAIYQEALRELEEKHETQIQN